VSVTSQLETLYDEGFRSLAVCLIHGYNFQGLVTTISVSAPTLQACGEPWLIGVQNTNVRLEKSLPP
jgi:hypothetical protein